MAVRLHGPEKLMSLQSGVIKILLNGLLLSLLLLELQRAYIPAESASDDDRLSTCKKNHVTCFCVFVSQRISFRVKRNSDPTLLFGTRHVSLRQTYQYD
jgi:hypothetical protein